MLKFSYTFLDQNVIKTMPQVTKGTHSHSCSLASPRLNMSTVMFSLCYNKFFGVARVGGGSGSQENAMIYNKGCVL